MDRRHDPEFTWKISFTKVMEVGLRVPLLFLMDSVLNLQILKLMPWTYMESELTEEKAFELGSTFLMTLLLLLVILVASAVTICLSAQQICYTYCFVVTACVLGSSIWSNQQVVTEQSWIHLLTNLVFQSFAMYLYGMYREFFPTTWPSCTNYGKVWQSAVYVIHLQAFVWRFVGLPDGYLQYVPLISAAIILSEFLFYLSLQSRRVYAMFKASYYSCRYMIHNFGIQTFLENHWTRLYVPPCFRIFWIGRTVVYTISFFIYKYPDVGDALPDMSVVDMFLLQLVYGCDSMIALMGMTSIVSYLAHYFGVGLAGFLRSDNEDDRNMGTMSAILFFILALQTGLTGLDQELRMARLLKNFCLLCTAILHYVHSMVNPLLLNLSASHRLSISLHWRPLALCACLLLVPSAFLFYLWSRYTISTWLLAVTAFSVEVILKVIISLLVYALFIIDAHRDRFWEQLDDYVYYIQSVGNTIEFLFGIFLFCNGGWIMLFESGGTIRAIMMCIHAYFNIWVQARDGWKAFMLRRTAVRKITSLPEASKEQLAQYNDVCAICYQDLASARITACQHLFHGVCLRKWLYVREECPMCHQLVHAKQPNQENHTEDQQHEHQD